MYLHYFFEKKRKQMEFYLKLTQQFQLSARSLINYLLKNE